MRSEARQYRLLAWINAAPWLVLVIGVALALSIVTLTMNLLMGPPFAELATLVGTLAATSILSLATGYLLYRRGWTRSPSLTVTLILTYAWAALLTLFNVWVLAQLMFVDSHDLTLAGVLLIFAAIIATTFGIFVAASVTDGLRQLAQAASRLAKGELATRATVTGRDEVAQVSLAFNDMAAQLQAAAAMREEVETLAPGPGHQELEFVGEGGDEEGVGGEGRDDVDLEPDGVERRR